MLWSLIGVAHLCDVDLEAAFTTTMGELEDTFEHATETGIGPA